MKGQQLPLFSGKVSILCSANTFPSPMVFSELQATCQHFHSFLDQRLIEYTMHLALC